MSVAPQGGVSGYGWSWRCPRQASRAQDLPKKGSPTRTWSTSYGKRSNIILTFESQPLSNAPLSSVILASSHASLCEHIWASGFLQEILWIAYSIWGQSYQAPNQCRTISTRSPRAEEEARGQKVDVASHMHDIYTPPPKSFASCGQTVLYELRCIQTASGRRHLVRPILIEAINVYEFMNQATDALLEKLAL